MEKRKASREAIDKCNLSLSFSFLLLSSLSLSLSTQPHPINSPQRLVVVLAAVSEVADGPRDDAGELGVHGDKRVPLDDAADERHLLVEVVRPDLAHSQDVAVGRDRCQAVGDHALPVRWGAGGREEKGRRGRNGRMKKLFSSSLRRLASSSSLYLLRQRAHGVQGARLLIAESERVEWWNELESALAFF